VKTTLLAATAALTLTADTAFAKSGAHDTSVNSANSLPPGFNDGNLTYQTFQRLRREAMEHERRAVLAERARQQQNTSGTTPRPRVTAAQANDAVDDE
jgi:hypothetical protein